MTLAWRFALASFAWGMAEATLFFIVPDVLLSYIGLKHGPRSAVMASLFAAAGAAVGGGVMYMWSALDPVAAYAAALALPAISEQMAAAAESAMRDNWFVAVLLGPIAGAPFKLYAMLAPHQPDISLARFVVAAIPARLPRFLIVSVGVAILGRLLTPRLGERQRLQLLLGAWAVFYLLFFALMPN